MPHENLQRERRTPLTENAYYDISGSLNKKKGGEKQKKKDTGLLGEIGRMFMLQSSSCRKSCLGKEADPARGDYESGRKELSLTNYLKSIVN